MQDRWTTRTGILTIQIRESFSRNFSCFVRIPSLTFDMEYFLDLDQFKIGKNGNWMNVIPDNSSDDSINSSEVSSSDYSVDFATEKDSISLSLMTHKL